MVDYFKALSNLSSGDENRDWEIMLMKWFDNVAISCQASLTLSRSMTS